MGMWKSSLAKKYWMAATGLFLILFLIGHLAGNLQLLLPLSQRAKDRFNLYAAFMTHNPVVKILSYLTYTSILLHIVDGIALTIQNRRARGKVRYAKNKPAANSSWSSRNMGLLGTIIGVFIVIHLINFWAKVHFGPIETYTIANHAERVQDLYTLTIQTFQDAKYGLWLVLFYTFAMLSLAFHLSHGFAAAFQSLGINHPKYNGLIQCVGAAFAIVVPLLFAFIPLYIRFVLDPI
ncbi:MAG: succinate dehydrogenase cytochrome b subunit [Flavobacteriales bacterium]